MNISVPLLAIAVALTILVAGLVVIPAVDQVHTANGRSTSRTKRR
jgi:hypothetical protein